MIEALVVAEGARDESVVAALLNFGNTCMMLTVPQHGVGRVTYEVALDSPYASWLKTH